MRLLLAANKRLNTAYLLKESFGQLWDYNSEAWARKFFDITKSHLMSDWDAMSEIGGHLALGLGPRLGDQMFLVT